MTAANERYDAPPSSASPPSNPAGKPAMRLIVALLKRSRGSFAIALTACVLNGIASVLLVATLSRALSQPGAADMSLAMRFAGRRSIRPGRSYGSTQSARLITPMIWPLYAPAATR